jgi:putative N6-adenine-specific DNA methylase
MPADVLSALAVTAPGLAAYTSQELQARGIAASCTGVEGVSFHTSWAGVYAANLWLRTASRVIVRIAAFHAESFHELERRAQRIPWDRYVTPTLPVRFRVTCRKSRLYHSDAIAERLAASIQRIGGVVAVQSAAANDTEPVRGGASGGASEQLVVVRMYRDQCTISLDSSGELLHRRGYRQQTAKAPLRETLAAGLLTAAGWTGQGPLVDPMCGAGTLPIEGAWLARDRAPGLGRTFAFMSWPEFDRAIWDELVADARAAERPTAAVVIQASDRDAGAIAATRGNAERAGVAGDIEISQRPLADIEPPTGPGWLVANPPYGVRVGAEEQLHDLYAQLAAVARAKCAGWTMAVLAADPGLVRRVGLSFTTALRTVNGGIPVAVLTATVPRPRGGRRGG